MAGMLGGTSPIDLPSLNIWEQGVEEILWFHLLVHSLNGHSRQGWVQLKPGASQAPGHAMLGDQNSNT